MKKLLFFFFVIINTYMGNCQTAFIGGGFGGFTGSQIDGDNLAGYHKIGITLGAWTRTKINDELSTQLELRYTGKGAFGNTGSNDNPDIYQVSFGYTEIPVVLQYHLSSKIFIDAGLSVGYLNRRRIIEGGYEVPESEIKKNGDYNKLDYCWLVGLNYRITENMTINFRYNYSIVPIKKRNVGRYQGWIVEALNLPDGFYNNMVSVTMYYELK